MRPISKKGAMLAKKAQCFKKGRNVSKKGAIKGAIKTLRPMLKPLVSLTITIKRAQCFKI